MAYVEHTVTINGLPAQLADFGEYMASIQLSTHAHTFRRGEPLRFTVFMNLMNKLVPVPLQGEVVQPNPNGIEVMYVAPTPNWSRILDSLKRHDALFSFPSQH